MTWKIRMAGPVRDHPGPDQGRKGIAAPSARTRLTPACGRLRTRGTRAPRQLLGLRAHHAMAMTTRFCPLGWFMLATAACVGPDIDYGEVKTVEVSEANPGGYRLSSGDELQIVFAYHPERNVKLTVRPDGRVSM